MTAKRKKSLIIVLSIAAALLLVYALIHTVWTEFWTDSATLVYEGPDGQKIIIEETAYHFFVEAEIYLKDGFFSCKEKLAVFSHDPPLGAAYDVTWSEDAVTVAFCGETIVTHPLD